MARFTDSRNSYRLEGIATPTNDSDAANKRYVDTHSGHISNLIPGPGIDTDQLENNNRVQVHSRPNFGLETYTQGVGLSSAFIDAASVLALSTQYDTPSSLNSAVVNVIARNDPGNLIMSAANNTDDDATPVINSVTNWTDVRSVFLSTFDASSTRRSIASLGQYFEPGSILEIRRTDSDYAVWHISQFSNTFGNNDITVLNITSATLTGLDINDAYGDPKVSGLVTSQGNPGANGGFGESFTVILHGRDRIREGRLIANDSLRTPKLWTNNEAEPTTGDFLQAGSDGAFHWSGLAPENITSIVGDIDAWTGRDTEYLVARPDTEIALTAGQLRFRTVSSIAGTNTATLSPGTANRLDVYPHPGQHATLMQQMVAGSPIKFVQGTQEIIALPRSVSESGGVYTFAFSGTTEIQFASSGSIDTDNGTFEFRPTIEAPVVRGDIQPFTIQGQDVNGGELAPFHMSATDTAEAALKGSIGRVPTTSSTTLDENTGWVWRRYDAYGSADNVQNELLQFEDVVHAGIGAIPVDQNRDLRRPREFTSINFERDGTRVTGVTFGYLAKDERQWLNIQRFFDSEGEVPYAGQDVTVHMQTSYKPTASDTDLADIDFFINTTEPTAPGMVLVDTDSDTVTFRINTASAGNVIALDDTQGNASSIPASDFTGGNGYWRNIHIFDGVGERADLTAQFEELGNPVFNYDVAYNTVIPVIRDNDDQSTPNIRMAGLGAGIHYDSDTNEIYVDTEDAHGIRVMGLFGDRSDVNHLIFNGATITNVGDNDATVFASNVRPYSNPGTFYNGQIVYDDDNRMYRVVATGASGVENVALSNSNAFVPLTTGATGGGGDGVRDSDVDAISLNVNEDNQINATITLNSTRTIVGTNSNVTFQAFDTERAGFVPSPTGAQGNTHYYVAGDGTWQQAHFDKSYTVFTDSESGLVPSPGHPSTLTFLNSDGQWTNPIAVIDSEDIAHVLDFTVEYDAPIRELEFKTNSRIPAVPGTNGQRAWVVLTFANASINSNGTQGLPSSTSLRLRAPTDQENRYTTFDVHWSSNDIPQGHGSEGYVDVARIWANAIGRQYSHIVTVADIGTGDGTLTMQYVNEGPMAINSRDSDNDVIEEFDTSLYTVAATYAQPGAERGNTGEYQDGVNAVGSYHTNGRAAKDTEKVFDIVTLPLMGDDAPGLVPVTADQPDSETVLTPGGWQDTNWIGRGDPFDIVEKVDAFGKTLQPGLYWNTNGTLNRALVQVRIGGRRESDGQYTKALYWDTVDGAQRLNRVEYNFGHHTGTGAIQVSARIAVKHLHWNSDGQLEGTTINNNNSPDG